MKDPPLFLPVVAVLAIGLMIPMVSEARVIDERFDGKKLEASFESLEGDMIRMKLRERPERQVSGLPPDR